MMPIDRLADMEEKLRILEDLNMIYIRQIALSLKVNPFVLIFTLNCELFFYFIERFALHVIHFVTMCVSWN